MASHGEVLYQIEPKPKRKSNISHKPAKEMKADESDSDSSKMDTFQLQALEIRKPGPDFDPTAPPKDGDEYLTHMLYERKKCPVVMVRQPKICKKNETAALVENLKDEEKPQKSFSYGGMQPTKEWKHYQLTDFEAKREKIVLLRLELHRQKYEQSLEPPLTGDPVAWRKFCQENSPFLKIILRFSQRTLEQLLEFICDWLRGGEETDNVDEPIEDPTTDPIPSTSNTASNVNLSETSLDLTGADAWLGTWLYAALACLHIPIEPEVHSTLRDIARICIQLRGRVPEEAAKKAVPYNLFILLIAKAFGQMDFAESV